MAKDNTDIEVNVKYPSKLLLFVIALFIAVGPFTNPNGLWFCWCCAASLTYIYINMSMKYRRWENEQKKTMESKKHNSKRDSQKLIGNHSKYSVQSIQSLYNDS